MNMLFNNPVLLREMRERVTGRRTMVMLTLWLLILSVTVALYYSSQTGGFGVINSGGSPVTQIARVGQNLYELVLFFMIGLVLFLVPGFTAASIAGERERQTLLPLQVTMLRPVDIIVGKVAASLAFTVLLLIATLPLLAFAFLIGGITISEVFSGLAMVVFSAFTLACLTVACSALVKRVQGAIVLAYGLVLVMVVGTFVAFGLAYAIDESQGWDQPNPPMAILAINPLAAVADVSGEPPAPDWFGFRNDVDTPLAVIREVMRQDNFNGGFEQPVAVDNFGNPLFPDDPAQSGGPRFWMMHVAVMSVLSLLSLLVAARRVRTPAKTER